jgi:hypothetical protein
VRLAVAAVGAAAVLALVGCGSPGPSAPTACKDFAAWQQAQRGHINAALDMSELQAAGSAAPKGKLHVDIHSVWVLVTYFREHPHLASAGMTEAVAGTVRLDCAGLTSAP